MAREILKNLKGSIFILIVVFLIISLADIQTYASGNVESLIRALSSNKSSERQRAAEKLGELRAEDAIPDLIHVLAYEKRPNVLSAVAGALIKIGPSAVPPLIKLSRANEYAKGILENMDTATFIQVLNNQDSNARSFAASMLQRRGEKAVPALIEALKNNDKEIRHGAIQILWNMGEVAVPPLIQALNDNDKLIRQGAIYILGNKKIEKAIPSLLQCLKSDDKSIQQSAEWALKQMGGVVITPLLKAMEDDDQQVQQLAIKILLSLNGNEVYSPLVENLSSNSKIIRNYSNAILERKGADALPSLILALKEKDAETSQYIANLILKLDHKESVPALIQALNSDDNGRIATLIVKIKLPALPYLIEAQKNNDDNFRQRSAHIIDKFESKDVIPPLLEALKDVDSNIRSYASSTLTKKGVAALPNLVPAIQDSNKQVRQLVIQILGNIGPEAKAAIPPLTQVLKDQDRNIRLSAIEALIKIGADATVVTALIPLLKDSDSDVRKEAIESLAKIGPVAKAAVQPLIQISKEGDKPFQNYAIEALEKIATPDALYVVRVYRQREKAELEAIRAKAEAEQKRREEESRKKAEEEARKRAKLGIIKNAYGEWVPFGTVEGRYVGQSDQLKVYYDYGTLKVDSHFVFVKVWVEGSGMDYITFSKQFGVWVYQSESNRQALSYKYNRITGRYQESSSYIPPERISKGTVMHLLLKTLKRSNPIIDFND